MCRAIFIYFLLLDYRSIFILLSVFFRPISRRVRAIDLNDKLHTIRRREKDLSILLFIMLYDIYDIVGKLEVKNIWP